MSLEVEEKILVLGVPTAKPPTLRKVVLHRVHTKACLKGVPRDVDADDVAAFHHMSCPEIVQSVALAAQAGVDKPSFNGLIADFGAYESMYTNARAPTMQKW